jgi:transposase
LSDHQDIELVGGWEGYTVRSVERGSRRRRGVRRPVMVELEVGEGEPGVCSGCGRRVDREHERARREVRDLPILGAETTLLMDRRRFDCSRCGPKLERLSWLEPWARVTNRLADAVARLCEFLPIKQVAAFYGLSWGTVKEIHKSFLERELGPVDVKGVRMIAMDEFAIQKGHRYATVVLDPQSKRVLWVCRGRSREDIRPFFELLGQEGREGIEAVAMDMSTSYEQEVRKWCPNAQIVYDLFHIVAKYGREVIDRTRVDEANRLRHDKEARKVVKGARWLLLRNKKNINSAEDRVRLKELLSANRTLAKVYIMRDDLKHLWDFRYPAAALRFWKGWYHRAVRSRIDELVKFAKAMKERLHGILSHCRYRLHTSLLEGMNNKIKVMKRMAYGFRDDSYFFLRIRAAFPGIR